MTPIDFQQRRIHRFSNPPDDEKALVREFFGQRHDGFFVDVGANHPVIESQTLHLEQLGWRGLLIEPLPAYCAMLRAERTGTVVPCACSSPANHGRKVTIQVAGGHSTLNAVPIALGTRTDETAQVDCRTLDSVLEGHGVATGFEFLSIDIEGHEMEMLAGFSLPRWRPQLVLLEDHVIGLDKHRHMTTQGYELILRTGLDSWYVPTGSGYAMSALGRLQRWRKYWLGLPLRQVRFRQQH